MRGFALWAFLGCHTPCTTALRGGLDPVTRRRNSVALLLGSDATALRIGNRPVTWRSWLDATALRGDATSLGPRRNSVARVLGWCCVVVSVLRNSVARRLGFDATALRDGSNPSLFFSFCLLLGQPKRRPKNGPKKPKTRGKRGKRGVDKVDGVW